MNNPQRPINIHDIFHAHVYFNSTSLEFATELCVKAGETFDLTVGRVHQKPVGPHTMWSCQILFKREDFEQLIPWLDENRGELSVLVHGVTGDNLLDHTDYAYWLGDAVALDLSCFKKK